jgi:spoIIIJ-associated protein
MSEKSLEVSGKTVEEAIEKGLAELGLPRDAVDIEILNEGSRGLLGLRNEEARVRLTPLAETISSAIEPAMTDGVSADAKEILETLLRGMGLRASVEVLPDAGAEDAHAFVLNIVGDDLGVLIGRRGETLRDLEYMTRLLAAHKTNKPPKLVVDVEGYRTRRERSLRELAKRMAERVQSNRQPITLEAMPPNERRIVHLSLHDHPTVKTQSIGEGDHRRVMIIPK